MRVLSLDQSSTHTGFVVVEDGKIIDMGCIDVPDSLELSMRVVAMAHDVEKLIAKHHPEFLVVEEIYARPGRYTAFKALAIVRGAIMWVWWLRSLSLPLVIGCSTARAQLGIKGNADKQEVMRAVNTKFNLKITNEHIADAVVLAAIGYQMVGTPKKVKAKITKVRPKKK